MLPRQFNSAGITKVFHTDDCEALLHDVGVTSRLIHSQAQIKEASSDGGSGAFTRDEINQFRPDKDHFLIHTVIMGDEEHYGPNKNHDGWEGKWLNKKVGTFVTNGRYYREHRNRHAGEGIGEIKAAKYNPISGRAELLKWGRLKPTAESKLTAEPEYERLKQGKEVDHSMSARVPYDVCVKCGNEAKTPALYCGCMKKQAGKFDVETQRIVHVLNPDPNFFDSSSVANRADRTARYLSFIHPEGTAKAAAVSETVTGADWAAFEGVLLPVEATHYDVGLKREMLRKLASAERELSRMEKSSSAADRHMVGLLTSGLASQDWTDDALKQARAVSPALLMRKLAAKRAIMPPLTFFAYVADMPIEDVRKLDAVKAASSLCCGDVFSDVLQGGFRTQTASDLDICNPGGAYVDHHAANFGDPIDKLMADAEDKFSLDGPKVNERVLTITISIGLPKSASAPVVLSALPADVQHDARVLAEAYVAYKVAAAAHLCQQVGCGYPDNRFLLALVGQNRVAL